MARPNNLSPYGVAKMMSQGLSVKGMKDLYDTVEDVAMQTAIASDNGEGNSVNMRRYARFSADLLGHVEDIGREMEEEEAARKKAKAC